MTTRNTRRSTRSPAKAGRETDTAKRSREVATMELDSFPVIGGAGAAPPPGSAAAAAAEVAALAAGEGRPTLIEDPALLVNDVRRYCRKWSRQEVRVPAEVLILILGDRVFDRGVAQITDISMRGALLSKLQLKKMVLPMKPFTIRLRFSGKRYKGIAADCKPVRFAGDGEFQLGVEFTHLWVEV